MSTKAGQVQAMYEGEGGITPREVPALVFNTYPDLRPTSKNKMFNARITWAAFDYREPTSQSATKTGRQHNASRFEKLISGLQLRNSGVSPSDSKSTQFQVKWARADHDDVVSFLRSLQWSSKTNPIQAELEFIGRRLAPVDSWLVIAPQVKQSAAGSWRRTTKNSNAWRAAEPGSNLASFLRRST